MTQQMLGSMGASTAETNSHYEYSTAYTAPKAKQIYGSWQVTEHTVDDIPYPDLFCKATFKDIPTANIGYDAVYDFKPNLCIKKVRIYCEFDNADTVSTYEYRMNVVLTWELKPNSIEAIPVLGYQYSVLDGKSAAVKDLPPSTEIIHLSLKFEDDVMILEDGTDIKTLERVGT